MAFARFNPLGRPGGTSYDQTFMSPTWLPVTRSCPRGNDRRARRRQQARI